MDTEHEIYQQSHLLHSPSHLSQTGEGEGGQRGPHKGGQTQPRAQLLYGAANVTFSAMIRPPAVTLIDDIITLMWGLTMQGGAVTPLLL